MNDLERLTAIEDIRQAKARYFRGVDSLNGALIQTALSENCVLDYMGCCTDPGSGTDFLPMMNKVFEGRASMSMDASGGAGMRSAHVGHMLEVDFTAPDRAEATWSFTDRLWFPEGAPVHELKGFGYYHETYVKEDGRWVIDRLRIERIKVEAV